MLGGETAVPPPRELPLPLNALFRYDGGSTFPPPSVRFCLRRVHYHPGLVHCRDHYRVVPRGIGRVLCS
jgi:hypothetical protein